METVLRVAAVYLFVLISLRLIGKREFGQLSPFDLVTLLLIPDIASQAMVREDYSLTNAFVGLSTLLLLVLITSIISHGSARAERLIAGSPTVLVHGGEFVLENMNRERVTPADIFGAMHRAGLSRVQQIRWAILESDGKISLVPEEGRQVQGDLEEMDSTRT